MFVHLTANYVKHLTISVLTCKVKKYLSFRAVW